MQSQNFRYSKRLAVLLFVATCFLNTLQAQDYYQLTWRQFYALPEAQKLIDVNKPDYELIDAAFFHATNEAREQENRRVFQYSPILYNSASGHSVAMIEKRFYAHEDRTDSKRLTPTQRIKLAGSKFRTTGENIAQFEVIDTGGEYCPRLQKNGEYRYFKCNTEEMHEPYSAITFAQKVVKGWMNSPGHRRNILNADYEFMACAARIMRNPYRSKMAPYARITQNFGGGSIESSRQSRPSASTR